MDRSSSLIDLGQPVVVITLCHWSFAVSSFRLVKWAHKTSVQAMGRVTSSYDSYRDNMAMERQNAVLRFVG